MNARPFRPSFDAPEPVMTLAGAWLARKDRGFTPAEREDFERWVRSDPIHAAAVAQLERTMTAFDRLRELAPQDGSKPDCDAFAPARASRRWLPATSIGIAAAVAVTLWLGRPSPSGTWHYTTSTGGYDRTTLVDGSIVRLNTDTAVEVEFTARERRVRLTRGEAHFEVAKDADRPFVVQAETVSVSALGTAFNVRLDPAGVEVLVTHGRVRVEPPAPATLPSATRATNPPATPPLPLLTAGHRVTVPTDVSAAPSPIATVSPEEIQRALAWQTRVAEFSRTPLSAAIAEFNRQNQQRIVIHDPELESLRIGGNFRTDQPEAFVRLLETSFGITATRSGQIITLHKAAESP